MNHMLARSLRDAPHTLSLSRVSALPGSLSLSLALSGRLCVLMINNVWMETCFRLCGSGAAIMAIS